MINMAAGVQVISYTEVCVCIFVYLLCSAKDMTAWKLFDPCLELLKSRIESRDLDKEVCDRVRSFY